MPAPRNGAANDFVRLRELCPQLAVVGINGQTSDKFAPQFEARRLSHRRVAVDVTGAHASLSLNRKLADWRQFWRHDWTSARTFARWGTQAEAVDIKWPGRRSSCPRLSWWRCWQSRNHPDRQLIARIVAPANERGKIFVQSEVGK